MYQITVSAEGTKEVLHRQPRAFIEAVLHGFVPGFLANGRGSLEDSLLESSVDMTLPSGRPAFEISQAHEDGLAVYIITCTEGVERPDRELMERVGLLLEHGIRVLSTYKLGSGNRWEPLNLTFPGMTGVGYK